MPGDTSEGREHSICTSLDTPFIEPESGVIADDAEFNYPPSRRYLLRFGADQPVLRQCAETDDMPSIDAFTTASFHEDVRTG